MFLLEKIVPFIGIDFDHIVDSSRRSKRSERKNVGVKEALVLFSFFLFAVDESGSFLLWDSFFKLVLFLSSFFTP